MCIYLPFNTKWNCCVCVIDRLRRPVKSHHHHTSGWCEDDSMAHPYKFIPHRAMLLPTSLTLLPFVPEADATRLSILSLLLLHTHPPTHIHSLSHTTQTTADKTASGEGPLPQTKMTGAKWT